jgi:prepilin-type N-terminal cleavage/methylation domain-containing protein
VFDKAVLHKQRGFTFIELILVLAIVAVLFTLVGFRTGTFTFWKEEGFIRNFAETTRFLFQQASADQVSYQLEVNLKNNTYRIGALVQENNNVSDDVAQQTSDLGLLSLELATILNPAQSKGDSSQGPEGGIIPPPSFPSLYDPQSPPNGMKFVSIRNSRQKIAADDKGSGAGYVYFASGGFSDFAAIEMEQSDGQRITFVVNPFTAQVDIYRNSTDLKFEDLFQMQSKQDSLGDTSLSSGGSM